MNNRNVAIIGAGLSGLAAAYRLACRGIQVSLYEAGPASGGLARCFRHQNHWIDTYYHFFCRTDYELFELLQDLDLYSAMSWKKTHMGLYYNNKLMSFGNPLDLVTFPFFSLKDKLKFGWGIMSSKAKNREDWRSIENIPAPVWLKQTFGEKAYEVLHEPLIRLKFGSHKEKLSAAWIWARIFRIGKSRTAFQQEYLGFLQGGMHRLITRLEQEIRRRDGTIHVRRPVQAIETHSESLVITDAEQQKQEFRAVLSTVSPGILRRFLDNPEGPFFDNLESIQSIGVACLLLMFKESFSPYFWLNINHPDIPLAGLIETSNLNPMAGPDGSVLIYAPQYLSPDDERFNLSRNEMTNRVLDYMKMIKPSFSPDSLMKAWLFKDRYAQPICETGFSDVMPPIKTPIPGLFMTDSCQLHPDDRTVANSIGLGNKGARFIQEFLAD